MMKIIIILGLFFSFSLKAEAASITKIKGNKALVDITGLENVAVGSTFFALDGQGKRKAILKITQVKGSKALAEITKGKAETGYELGARKSSTQTSAPPPETHEQTSEQTSEQSTESHEEITTTPRSTGQQMGVLFGLLQTSMTANFTVNSAKVSASMGGTSFGLSGYYDYPLFGSLQLRGLAGYEQVSAAGSSGSTTYDFKVSYLSLYGLGKYNFSSAPSKFWIVGGGGFLIAMSKSSSIINESQISTNQVFTVGAGYDIALSRKTVIPISLEYSMFPPSDTVSASIINFRVGYGWNM